MILKVFSSRVLRFLFWVLFVTMLDCFFINVVSLKSIMFKECLYGAHFSLTKTEIDPLCFLCILLKSVLTNLFNHFVITVDALVITLFEFFLFESFYSNWDLQLLIGVFMLFIFYFQFYEMGFHYFN